jgi:signal transduction histidine kinase
MLPDMFNDLLDGFSEQVAVVDEEWNIITVNGAWKQMVKVAGYPELVPGTNYRDFLQAFANRGHDNAIAVLDGIRAIDEGATDEFEFGYAGVSEWEGRALKLRIHRLRIQGRLVATIARYDVTDSVQIDRVRQECTAAVLNSEAEARQRLTRELHDSTGQLLTSIGLSLAVLKRRSDSSAQPVIDEIEALLRQATYEIRSVSFLAQAPNVGAIGIVDALSALAHGFGRRSGMEVAFELVGKRIRVPLATKTALYRIAQEALSNVSRHADTRHAKVHLVFRKRALHLIIADDGKGISDETLAGRGNAGVGLCSMRSRLAEIGGRLTVRRLEPGTAVVASLPVGRSSGRKESKAGIPT